GLGVECVEEVGVFFDFVSDVSVHTLAEVVAGNADAQTSHRFGDFVGVGWNRFGGGSGIVGIASGNGLQDRGDVFHVVGKRADAIERGCESDQAVTRNAAVAAHHGGGATESSRLADRAAHVRGGP